MAVSDDIVSHLGRFDAKQQLAILEALEEKRKREQFVKYWTPTDEQKQHFEQFTQDIKIFGILGGNRSGKTEEGAFIAMAWALGKDYFKGEPVEEYVNKLPIPTPPNNIWIVGLDFPTLRDVIWREKLRYGRAHPGFLPKDPGINPKDGEFQIFFPNGSVITGKSADSGREKFQSASVDLVWIDEEPEKEIFDECFQRTADCAGKLLLTLTPLVDVASGVRTPWVFDLWEDWRAGQHDVCFVKLSVLNNPYVPEEEKARLVEKWAGSPEERARLYGDFIQRSGLVYNLWDPKKHLVDPFKIPRDWRRIVSIDPAATGTTAVVWGAVEPGTDNLYLYREYYRPNLIVSDHAKNILARNGADPVDVWLIDPKWGSQRNGETHKTGMQLYRESGIPVRLAEVDEDYGVQESREYIGATLEPSPRHPKVFVFRDLHAFQDEISHYVWDTFQKGEQKGLSKDKPLKRKDHMMNAFQYLCAMRPRARRMRPMPSSDEDKRKFAEVNSY